ncbi:MAG: adenylyl-sulfate kinase [Deltaproteobacteria bacterium]|nr:adenylyl-sulfate kinase [Deltaproteobacteria bacterium]
MDNPKSENITWHNQLVTLEDKIKLHGHKGATIWFTGLSGSGKSTLANALSVKLHNLGISTAVLDGDNIRYGLNKNLGFSPEDRKENVRRIGEVARLFSSNAIINLTAFISPYIEDRATARELQPESFIEVYCYADVSVCEKRDPKGLYKKVRAGEIESFTGINAPYEAPVNPEVIVDTGRQSIDECINKIVEFLKTREFIN